jgi:hypothetical protein
VPVIAVGFLVIGQIVGNGGQAPAVADGLEAVFPSPGAKALSQATVGADLALGWSGRLTINGTPVPPDQLEVDSGLNMLTFRPGPGKVVEALRPDENCATVVVWRARDGEATAGAPTRWCFRVL